MTHKAIPSSQPGAAPNTHLLEGTIFEVLPGFGLAHLLATDGSFLGLNRGTPGVDNFDLLQVGQRWRCTVAEPFSRVTFARQLINT